MVTYTFTNKYVVEPKVLKCYSAKKGDNTTPFFILKVTYEFICFYNIMKLKNNSNLIFFVIRPL